MKSDIYTLRALGVLEWLRSMGATRVKLGTLEVEFAAPAEPVSKIEPEDLLEAIERKHAEQTSHGTPARDPLDPMEQLGVSLPTYPLPNDDDE